MSKQGFLNTLSKSLFENSTLSKEITSICSDSRAVIPGSLFFAISGYREDGHKYIAEAIERGAQAIITESAISNSAFSSAADYKVRFVHVPNVRLALAEAAAKFYGDPQKDLLTIGVTGTNGKTSVSWIVAEALFELGKRCSHVGTLGLRFKTKNSISDGIWRKSLTTAPDPLTLFSFLAETKSLGGLAASVEVSSHGLVQARSHGMDWDVCIFTNLTRDHIDFHKTFEEYGSVKAGLFTKDLVESSKKSKHAIINIDDAHGLRIANELKQNYPEVNCLTYSAGQRSAYAFIQSSSCGRFESNFEVMLDGYVLSIKSKLIGRYNLINMLAAACCLHSLGFSLNEIARGLGQVTCVPGRLERISNSAVFVDYAHTPDALVNAQKSLRELTDGRLITVFGCGGDRDRGKRPLMAEAVASLSDYIVLTSDNPRSEDPQKIIEDILPGFDQSRCRKEVNYVVIPERREAINFAIKIANKNDAVLIAGKGHEDYQEISGQKFPFDDRDVCKEALTLSNQ